MPIEVKATPRIFRFGSVSLPDMPGLDPEQIRAHYKTKFPALATATLSGPETTPQGLVWTFAKSIGEKG